MAESLRLQVGWVQNEEIVPFEGPPLQIEIFLSIELFYETDMNESLQVSRLPSVASSFEKSRPRTSVSARA